VVERRDAAQLGLRRAPRLDLQRELGAGRLELGDGLRQAALRSSDASRAARSSVMSVIDIVSPSSRERR
jgi:hypothetical protein